MSTQPSGRTTCRDKEGTSRLMLKPCERIDIQRAPSRPGRGQAKPAAYLRRIVGGRGPICTIVRSIQQRANLPSGDVTKQASTAQHCTEICETARAQASSDLVEARPWREDLNAAQEQHVEVERCGDPAGWHVSVPGRV